MDEMGNLSLETQHGLAISMFKCARGCTNESLELFTSDRFMEVSRALCLETENQCIVLWFVKAWDEVFTKMDSLGDVGWVIERFMSYFPEDSIWHVYNFTTGEVRRRWRWLVKKWGLSS
jgi:hypothetical protein